MKFPWISKAIDFLCKEKPGGPPREIPKCKPRLGAYVAENVPYSETNLVPRGSSGSPNVDIFVPSEPPMPIYYGSIPLKIVPDETIHEFIQERWPGMKEACRVEEWPKGHAFIQWKGTDACMDFHCECGHHNHYDAEFMYRATCEKCQQLYHVSEFVKFTPLKGG